MSLTAVVGHLSSDVFNYGDVDGGSFDFFYEDFMLNRKSTSGEVRLQSTTDGFLEWSIGAMIGKDSGTTAQARRHTPSPSGCGSPHRSSWVKASCSGASSSNTGSYPSTGTNGCGNTVNGFEARMSASLI